MHKPLFEQLDKHPFKSDEFVVVSKFTSSLTICGVIVSFELPIELNAFTWICWTYLLYSVVVELLKKVDLIKIGKEMEVFEVIFDSVEFEILFVESILTVYINVLNSIDEFVVSGDDNIVVSVGDNVVAGFDKLVELFL